MVERSILVVELVVTFAVLFALESRTLRRWFSIESLHER